MDEEAEKKDLDDLGRPSKWFPQIIQMKIRNHPNENGGVCR
jgi:hypothetical protein